MLIFPNKSRHLSHKMVFVISRIPAHRLVLYSASAYFKTMFTTAVVEIGQQEVSIKGVDGGVLRQLIEYCYSGEIAIDSDSVEEMTKAAAMLQFTQVKKKCAKVLTSTLSASNCLGIRVLADLHKLDRLKKAAHAFALDHFVEVSRCEEFLLLDVGQISALVKDDKLNVPDEGDVFNALIGWVKYDVRNRKPSVGPLLEHVRFNDVSDSVSISVPLKLS